MKAINELLTMLSWKMTAILEGIDLKNLHSHRELLIVALVGLNLILGITSAPMAIGIGMFGWVCSRLVDKN